jgi:hypothetical protein
VLRPARLRLRPKLDFLCLVIGRARQFQLTRGELPPVVAGAAQAQGGVLHADRLHHLRDEALDMFV